MAAKQQMTRKPAMPPVEQQVPIHLGWGLSGLMPYYLLGQTVPVSGIINGSGATLGQTTFDIPVYGPDYLSQVDPQNCHISAFPDLTIFGPSIHTQIAKYGEFTMSQATIWADEKSCEPEEYRDAVQHWIAENHRKHYQPELGRVCLFITKLDKGGAERQMVLLARGLTALGYQVTLICQSPDDSTTLGWQQQLSDANIARLWLSDARQTWQANPPDSQEMLWLRPLCRLLRPRGAHNVLALSRIYARIRPQYVISYLDDCNIVSAAAAIQAGVPFFSMSARSTEPNLLHQDGEPDFYVCQLAQIRVWYQMLLDQLAGAKLYANSRAGQLSYEKWLGRPLSCVVPNAVEAVPMIRDIDIRARHSLPHDCQILLGVMRLTPEKNPDGFIRVFAHLLQYRPNLKAILLGEGPMRPELEALLRQMDLIDVVLMPGKVDDPTAYLQQATCLLCPSFTEGMPNIVLEAQVQGIPLVCSHVGGIPEALVEELHQFLVPVANEQAMAESIFQVISNKKKYETIFEQSQKHIVRSRNYENLAMNTIEVFKAKIIVTP